MPTTACPEPAEGPSTSRGLNGLDTRFWGPVLRRVGAVLVVLAALSAQAQELDAGAPSAEPSWLDELDAAARGTVIAAPPPSTNPVVRAIQSLNPDLSVILDGTVGWAERAPLQLAGDDPDLGGALTSPAAGATLQEAEIAFSAAVDPYLRGDLYLTIPNLKGLEVEEALITTTALPANLQLKGGVLRSALGRQNGQHLHVQDFTRRPLLNAAYLGADGLRAPGLQLSWLTPAPFFLQLDVEAFSLGAPDDTAHFSSFGGGARTDLVYAAKLKAFFALSDSLSVAAGFNGATGVSAAMDALPEFKGGRTLLYGADLYVKWKPPNQVSSSFSLAWTTEYFGRRVTAALPSLEGPNALGDGGLYSQLVCQLARSWFLGLRQDVLGLPESPAQHTRLRTAASLTLAPTEFSRVRLYVEREFARSPAVSDAWGAYLQVEISMGAHGAHAF